MSMSGNVNDEMAKMIILKVNQCMRLDNLRFFTRLRRRSVMLLMYNVALQTAEQILSNKVSFDSSGSQK